jgi:predicted nucleic acid-binding protein
MSGSFLLDTNIVIALFGGDALVTWIPGKLYL